MFQIKHPVKSGNVLPHFRNILGTVRKRLNQGLLFSAATPKSALIHALKSEGDKVALEGLRELRVVDLQARLQQLGLPKNGLKEALVQRLHAAMLADAAVSVPDLQRLPPEPDKKSNATCVNVSEEAPAKRRALPKHVIASPSTDIPLTPELTGRGLRDRSVRRVRQISETESTSTDSTSTNITSTSSTSTNSTLTGDAFQRVRRALGSIIGGAKSGSKVSGEEDAPQDSPQEHPKQPDVRNEKAKDDVSQGHTRQQGKGSRMGSFAGYQEDLQGKSTASSSVAASRSMGLDSSSSLAKGSRVEDEEFMAKLQRALASPPPQWEPRSSRGYASATPLEISTQPGATAKPLTLPPLDRPRGIIPDEEGMDAAADWVPRSGHPQESPRLAWLGHRDPSFASAGRNHKVTPLTLSADTLGSSSSNYPFDSDSDSLPIRVNSKGDLVGIVEEADMVILRAQSNKAEIPALPPAFRGKSYGSNQLLMSWPEKERFVLGNITGLSMTFLGTSHMQASAHRAPSSIALLRVKDVIMFDAGDDTQRQLARMEHVRTSKVHRIFITCLSADCVTGLPGLLCTVSASREGGHENADIPVHLYGPPGLTDFISTALKVSNTFLNISIIVHEFSMRAVTPEEAEPISVNERSKIFRVLMPPDQLNPAGFIDGRISRFMPNKGRAKIRRGETAGGGVLGKDSRAACLPFEDPIPGDASRTDVHPLDMRWTIRMDTEGIITAMPLRAPRPTLAYVFREPDRAGNLMMDRVNALGVPQGACLGELKAGRSIVIPATSGASQDSDDNRVLGQIITPEMVLSGIKPGRKVIIMGTCSGCEALERQAEAHDADVIVAGGVTTSCEDINRSLLGGHLTASVMGSTAAALGAGHVLLSRFACDLHGHQTHPYKDSAVQALVDQVADELSPHQRVTAIHDFWIHVLEKHEGRAWQHEDIS